MRDRERERERQTHRQREMQAPCREPDVGFDPGTPGSHPGLKADAQPLSHPGRPKLSFKNHLVSPLMKTVTCVLYRKHRKEGEKRYKSLMSNLETPTPLIFW